jgi:16S rRNA (uracil1498-N3)-methyltransferase
MNLVLLYDSDFTASGTAVLRGRRREHVLAVHRVSVGDALIVGLEGGAVGKGVVGGIEGDCIELAVTFDADPPPPITLSLVLALPRPKVLNRVIAAATSIGIKRIALINAWRVEKSYWRSPRLGVENLRMQAVVGLEQARDTVLPEITTHRFFRHFVETELDALAGDSLRLAAHPYATQLCPRDLQQPVTLVVGPEGGFIPEEIESLARAGCQSVTLGGRVLRVETALAALAGRLK